jgi:hypothetical protein
MKHTFCDFCYILVPRNVISVTFTFTQHGCSVTEHDVVTKYTFFGRRKHDFWTMIDKCLLRNKEEWSQKHYSVTLSSSIGFTEHHVLLHCNKIGFFCDVLLHV